MSKRHRKSAVIAFNSSAHAIEYKDDYGSAVTIGLEKSGTNTRVISRQNLNINFDEGNDNFNSQLIELTESR